MNRQRTLQTFLAGCLAGAALLQGAAAQTALPPALAIKGYDPMGYFVENRAVKGVPAIAHDFDGKRYYFSSARNRAAFAADPDRYAPQFGGLCTAGLAEGRIVEADPTAFVVREGRLYLFSAAKGITKVDRDAMLIEAARLEYARK